MGVVWKAEDTKLQRHVALKVLPQSMAADPDRRARFEDIPRDAAGYTSGPFSSKSLALNNGRPASEM
jgi:hypothetical protein